MRILHIASLNSAAENIGVVRQMLCERDVARDLDLDWEIELWAGDSLGDFGFLNVYPDWCRGRLSRRRYFARLVQERSCRYDFLLIRYVPSDPFLPFIRRGSARLATVHHSKEGRSLKMTFRGGRGSLYALLDLMSCQIMLRRMDGIVGVTGEIVKYEKRRACLPNIPTIVSPNGIDLRRFPIANDERQGRLKLVFTASTFFGWHGLTRLLRSVAEYSSRQEVELHLVGRVEEEDAAFIEKAGIAASVVLHGHLNLEELRRLLARADVGIASFGLGDAGLNEACTLKVREYLAAGVPVFSGHRDVAFPTDFPYYNIGGPSVGDIARYASEMRLTGRDVVRHAAGPYIDKSVMVSRLYEWASEIVSTIR